MKNFGIYVNLHFPKKFFFYVMMQFQAFFCKIDKT